MIVKGPKDVQIGNWYMYQAWYSGVHNLKRGVCIGITDKSIKLTDPERPYLSGDEVRFIEDLYPKIKYSKIADYDKRIFNAYNKRIERVEKELEDIWNGYIKRERKRKKKGFWKRWFKLNELSTIAKKLLKQKNLLNR